MPHQPQCKRASPHPFVMHVTSTEVTVFAMLTVHLTGEDQSSPCAPPALRGARNEGNGITDFNDRTEEKEWRVRNLFE